MSNAPHLNYLGIPIQQSMHYGQLTDMRDMEVYLARTDQATFNVMAVLYPTLFSHMTKPSEKPLKEQLTERSEYDASWRRLYREMEATLPNGMTLREAALQLRPTQLQDQLRKWKPNSKYTQLMLTAFFNSAVTELACKLAELCVINL